MDESHEGYKLLRGVRIDIKALLTNFEETGSVRFSTFCEEWKRKKFSLIFCQRKTIAELLEFCEEVIHIAKGYLELPWSFPIRAGALFTLYGLYFKQPIKGAAKIRWTKEEWQHLTQFIQECKEAKHFDICFIHYKLYLKGAYVFTVVPRATGFERGYRKYEVKRKLKKNAFNETILKRQKLVEPALLQTLSEAESLYQDKKAEVLGKKNLDFVDRDFSASLSKKLSQFYQKIEEEYPVQAFEKLLASVKYPEEPHPSCSSTVVENCGKGMTLHEKAIKRLKERSAKKSDSTEVTDEKEEPDPNVPLALPDVS